MDAVIGGVAFWLAVIARVGHMPNMSQEHVILATLLAMVVVPLAGLATGIHRPALRFHAPQLAVRAGVSSALSGATVAVAALAGGTTPARALGLGVVFALVLFAFLIWSRQAARWLLGERHSAGERRCAIYGAGDAGRQLAAMLRGSREYEPVLFIDDDPSLRGRLVEDLLVVGSGERNFVQRLEARRVKEVLLAMPSLPPGRRREILEILSRLPLRVRSVPRLEDMVRGDGEGLGRLRDITLEELLGRNPVMPLPGLLEKCIKGKAVLVTGGGGSIGAELCRQVLALGARRLVVLDHSELALYQIEQELIAAKRRQVSAAELAFVLGSVVDSAVVEGVFREQRIDTVYHAAAYKHVPIVELNPAEGVRNNLIGTWYVARAAARAGAAYFILVSSDKAVRPTNVMGASKRMAELVVQMLSARSPATVFSMVRFGNVLGSSGSVVPLFRSQIDHGGPITLTHSDVTRFFMTIEEAVQLVIQAGAMAAGGEVFVLDMGEPVRIRDLAVKMVHLSGRTVREPGNPGGDIEIEVIGLRPGEKLYEELLVDGAVLPTGHPRICRARESAGDADALLAELGSLERLLRERPQDFDPHRVLAKWVAGYAPAPIARAAN